ncbi:peptidase S51 dipeptidase E family protein [Nitzschia inconspicua]|uniref:Peptidase S51 dipeptidase E family protein n=1 Tax=Nitzschia inconspicua TaxID=303405 RepID=A0A9K3LV17_9STRA|nr:peptidase S51 dipeptidase E family protein [Nitzschia inconspicua]
MISSISSSKHNDADDHYFHPNLKGVFVGSGSEGMADPRVADAILNLLQEDDDSNGKSPTVLYLGTATYDLPLFRAKQTQCLQDRGCIITSLDVAFDDATRDLQAEAQKKLQEADIIVVGGGNTLYAIDRWNHLGLVPLLRKAMERETVLTGGSAGAIVWFDGGHSDSMDPDTYACTMVAQYGNASDKVEEVVDERSTVGSEIKDWKYIRVDGLGFLPGLLCPHHDRIQSNGVLRASDFDEMLLRHPGERGIGIDHWAALVVNGESYSVLSLEGKPGSILASPSGKEFGVDESGNAKGVPGIWIKHGNGHVSSNVCHPNGLLSEILGVPSEIIRESDDVKRCREANPSGVKI